MSIEIEVTNDELKNILAGSGRIFMKLPIIQNGNFAIEKIIAFLREIEKSVNGIDIIVYSKFQLVHSKVPDSPKYPKSVLCETLIQKTHPDMLPYLEIIISLPTSSLEAVKSCVKEHELETIQIFHL